MRVAKEARLTGTRAFSSLVRKLLTRSLYYIKCGLLVPWFKILGPPRILKFRSNLNVAILRAFGAQVGKDVLILAPVTIHSPERDYENLVVGHGCIVNSNTYLDLSSSLILEEGVSLGPGVIVMTHNGFNSNSFLEKRLSLLCGFKPVRIKRGAGIKASALITMGVTIGENAVVAGGAVVNQDVSPYCFVAGVPAKVRANLWTKRIPLTESVPTTESPTHLVDLSRLKKGS